MISKKLFIISFFIATSIFITAKELKAEEQTIAIITTDVNNDAFQLIVDTSDDGQRLEAFKFDKYPKTNNDKDLLPIAKFINEGLRLPKNSRYNFASINGQNFDNEQGGIIIIDTLYNFLTGKRKKYELHLAKDKTGWKLYEKGEIISRIFAYANRAPIIGIIGAKELIMKK